MISRYQVHSCDSKVWLDNKRDCTIHLLSTRQEVKSIHQLEASQTSCWSEQNFILSAGSQDKGKKNKKRQLGSSGCNCGEAHLKEDTDGYEYIPLTNCSVILEKCTIYWATAILCQVSMKLVMCKHLLTPSSGLNQGPWTCGAANLPAVAPVSETVLHQMN